MNRKLLLPLTALAGTLLLTGCMPNTPLPTFGKAITPQWIKADFDGKPGDELIATSNLQDVVFNDRGEVIGWYVKSYAGTPYIKNNGGSYDFSALRDQKGIANMVGQAQVPGRYAFAVSGGDLDPAKEAQVTPPTTETRLEQNTQTAVFRYTQGGATVTKTVTLHPRNFKIDLKTSVQGGPESVNILFPGLGKNSGPNVQALSGGQVVQLQNQVLKNVEYAAMQEKPSQVAHALIVGPQAGTALDVTLTGGQQASIAAQVPAESNLQVYGGKNELIHLYQSGYAQYMPGLFKPNLFGQISLWIVKLMEFLYKIIGNWGLAIVAMTILVRLGMWPLMQAQGRSSARMQVMQPRIKEIQDRYKDKRDMESQRAMQAEMQQLYKDHNFNPAGCLSSFLPFPILIALWSTVRNFEFDKGFLWMPDLAIPDPLYIMALLYVLANIGQLYVMTRKSPEMFKQQIMIYVIFLYFAFTFPAGVIIYSVLSTLIGILQQVIINKQVERETQSLTTTVEKVTVTAPVKKKGGKVIDAPKE
ncbi:protein translocase component YidC [Deinococcus cavernae]|uniref:Membrane protein insertase YidC n=1 Tax=Deinococcus cavernae TaxID=2320857 RepID=A0A418VAC4_9DEIO|nr:membrane protein insertase YidC [Deinococcus cavernae]RJF73043.1 protein translocase component YidC [Deinococcus cavernae]